VRKLTINYCNPVVLVVSYYPDNLRHFLIVTVRQKIAKICEEWKWTEAVHL